MNKIIFCAILFLLPHAYAATEVSQELIAELPKFVYIKSVYVDGVKVSPCSQKIKLDIKKVNRGFFFNILELSPISLEVISNSRNVKIAADFLNLENPLYSFPVNNLGVKPDSVVTPYKESPQKVFVPTIKTTLDAKSGKYEGQILFTVGNA